MSSFFCAKQLSRAAFFLGVGLVPTLALAQAAAPASTPATAPPAAKPEDIGISKDFSPCMDKAQTVAREQQPGAVYTCLENERKFQDARINKAYNGALAKLPAEGKKRLTASQGNWARYRDSHCNFYADEKGAPPLNLNNSDCRLGMNVQRANEMANILRLVLEEEKAASAAGATAGAGAASGKSGATPAPSAPSATAPKTNMGAGSGMSLPQK